jgi:hypothetical protein
LFVLVAALLTAACAFPALAVATTVSAAGGRIAITAAAGETNSITFNEGDGQYTITEGSAPIEAGAGCTKDASAARVACPGAGVVVKVELGDGDDSFINSAGLGSEVDAGAGNDTVTGGFGDDVIRGDVGNDKLDGNTGNDTLIAGDGNDKLTGAAGDDSLQAGDGNDKLDGGDGNDTLTATDGADTLSGGAGNDRLEGGKGADSLDAGAGDDVLLTAEGEFTGTREKRIRCGAGRDRLTAGPDDSFVSDCEQADGASLRLQKGGRIPLTLTCASACKGSVRIKDAKSKIDTRAAVKGGAGKTVTVAVGLTKAEVTRLFRQKKVRLTASFALTGGQKVRATFTLLRRV